MMLGPNVASPSIGLETRNFSGLFSNKCARFKYLSSNLCHLLNERVNQLFQESLEHIKKTSNSKENPTCFVCFKYR